MKALIDHIVIRHKPIGSTLPLYYIESIGIGGKISVGSLGMLPFWNIQFTPDELEEFMAVINKVTSRIEGEANEKISK